MNCRKDALKKMSKKKGYQQGGIVDMDKSMSRAEALADLEQQKGMGFIGNPRDLDVYEDMMSRGQKLETILGTLAAEEAGRPDDFRAHELVERNPAGREAPEKDMSFAERMKDKSPDEIREMFKREALKATMMRK